jgi:hypothetical protein
MTQARGDEEAAACLPLGKKRLLPAGGHGRAVALTL